MGWETRKRGTMYYTRSQRIGGRVLRHYVGGGALGELAAMVDADGRAGRRRKAEALRAEVDRLARSEATLEILCEATEAAARTSLLLAGYHQHNRGEWRRRRDREQAIGE